MKHLLTSFLIVFIVCAPVMGCASAGQSPAYEAKFTEFMADGIITPEEQVELDYLESPAIPWDMIAYIVGGGGVMGTLGANLARNLNLPGTKRRAPKA